MGHREVIRRDNGINGENVYYSCKYLYPEMCYAMMALNKLIKIRACKLAKKRYDIETHENPFVLWDSATASIRGLQTAFAECLREHLTQNTFTRWMNLMHEGASYVSDMVGQFLDVLNVQYLEYSTEKRKKELAKIAKRLAECYRDKEYLEIKSLVIQGAKDLGCAEEEIRFTDFDYPDDIDW
jgi:hypothetical protein